MAHSSANSLLQRELLDTIKSLRATIDNLNSTVEDLRKSLAESQAREKNLQEQIETMTKRLYGHSSEKHMVQSEGQLDFFNEVELEADKQQEEQFRIFLDRTYHAGGTENVELEIRVTPEIHGGFILDVGSDEYDWSTHGRERQFETAIDEARKKSRILCTGAALSFRCSGRDT